MALSYLGTKRPHSMPKSTISPFSVFLDNCQQQLKVQEKTVSNYETSFFLFLYAIINGNIASFNSKYSLYVSSY